MPMVVPGDRRDEARRRRLGWRTRRRLGSKPLRGRQARDPVARPKGPSSDKVCTLMIMGRWAHEPSRVGFGVIPIAWRKDLDGWMLQRAVARGASVWDRSRVLATKEEQDRYRLTLLRNGEGVAVCAASLRGAPSETPPSVRRATRSARIVIRPSLDVHFAGSSPERAVARCPRRGPHRAYTGAQALLRASVSARSSSARSPSLGSRGRSARRSAR